MFAMVLVLTEIEEEAAQAYDVATMKYRGINAVTNFDIKNYDVDKIQSAESSRLTRKCLKIRENSTTNPRLVLGSSSNTVNPQINATVPTIISLWSWIKLGVKTSKQLW